MFDKSQRELWWWFCQRDARIGLSGSGLEPGSPRPWDEARAASAHGFHVDDTGSLYGTGSGKTGERFRYDLRTQERVGECIALLPPETKRLLQVAHDPCGASFSTAAFFNAEYQAPLVGLALVVWCELKPDETRAPQAIVDRWDQDLRRYDDLKDEGARRKQADVKRLAERILGPVRRRTIAVFDECLGVYEEIRSHVARERREAAEERARAIRARVR